MKNLSRKNIIVTSIAFVIACISFFPLYWLVTGAFKPTGSIFTFPPQFIPTKLTLENITKLFGYEIPFYIYFFNSALVSTVHVLGTLLLSSMAGYAFAKYKFKGRNILFSLVIAGMLIPFQSLIIPLFLITNEFNMVDTRMAIVIPFIAHPLGVFLMRQYIMSVPDSIIESARIDGASEFRIYWQIVSPIVKPAFAALAIVDFVEVWNGFVWSLTVLKSQSKFTLPIWLNSMIQDPYVSDYGLIFAGGLLTVLPIVVFFLLMQKQFISGLASGAED